MNGFWRYPRVSVLAGDELLVATNGLGTETVTVTVGQIAAAAPATSASGEFYQDLGCAVARRPDRLLVGAAADNAADSRRDTIQTDWLSSLMAGTSIGAWPVWGAQCASLARYGSIGFLGASHTSNVASNNALMGYVPSSIGVASWGVADDATNPTNATAYAYYGEAWRMAGVDYQPTFCMELEAVNLGGVPVGESTPFHPNTGGGTYGIQLGAGGGQTSGTSDAEAGIVFVSNPNGYRTGIIFAAGSLTGDDSGSGDGAGVAVNLAPGHIIGWCTPETVQNVQGAESGFTIQSQVTQAAQGSRIIAQNGSMSITTANGNAVMSVVVPDATPTNTLQVQAGVGAQAAGLYVAEGTGGSANLGLYPAAGGELQISSPVTGSGASIPGNTVPEGWLHINVNGTDYRVPLFSAAQAGG